MDQGEELFSRYLRDDPKWGWAWIGWSDQYYLFSANGNKDAGKAIDILKQGLEVEGLNDRENVLDRLHHIYNDLNMRDEAEEVMQKLNQIRGRKKLSRKRMILSQSISGERFLMSAEKRLDVTTRVRAAVGKSINDAAESNYF